MGSAKVLSSIQRKIRLQTSNHGLKFTRLLNSCTVSCKLSPSIFLVVNWVERVTEIENLASHSFRSCSWSCKYHQHCSNFNQHRTELGGARLVQVGWSCVSISSGSCRCTETRENQRHCQFIQYKCTTGLFETVYDLWIQSILFNEFLGGKYHWHNQFKNRGRW